MGMTFSSLLQRFLSHGNDIFEFVTTFLSHGNDIFEFVTTFLSHGNDIFEFVTTFLPTKKQTRCSMFALKAETRHLFDKEWAVNGLQPGVS